MEIIYHFVRVQDLLEELKIAEGSLVEIALPSTVVLEDIDPKGIVLDTRIGVLTGNSKGAREATQDNWRAKNLTKVIVRRPDTAMIIPEYDVDVAIETTTNSWTRKLYLVIKKHRNGEADTHVVKMGMARYDVSRPWTFEDLVE